ncbi:MAG: hypothetical protein HYV65_00560 [Candidatus Spechtbacteria bacterium]|nr:hypothetical protein [Candidatus Spechtbacteria bacterium]
MRRKFIQRNIVTLILMITVGVIPTTFIYAANPISSASKCTVRADLDAADVNTLIGSKFQDPVSTNQALLPADTVLPAESTDAINSQLDNNDLLTPKTSRGLVMSGFGVLCTFSLIRQIFNILFLIIGTLSVVIILYAAFLFLTAGQQPNNITRAKNLLLYAVFGIVLAVVARLLPSLIIGFLGTK